MVLRRALCIEATDADAGVLAALTDAGPIRGAVLVNHTLRPAVGRRSKHASGTRALGPVVDIATVGIGPAGAGQAGIHVSRRFGR